MENDVRIGKQDQPFSAICTSDAESISVHGRDLCGELIGKVGFTEYFWLLTTGAMPDRKQIVLTDSVLVALAEHGLVPSVVAARMTLAAAPEALQGAVAAGLLGCGSVVLGSAEVAGDFLTEGLAEMDAGASADAAARTIVARRRAARKAIPGFGHPQHSGGDPRAHRLLAIAEEQGTAGRHIALLHAVERCLPEAIGRELPININGAIPAVMLDGGFPLTALKGIALLARTAGLIGHLREERERPIGFILSGQAAAAIDYDGPPPPKG
jgi:citrate synthase